MKKLNFKTGGVVYPILLFTISVILFTTCDTKEETEDCNTRTKRNQYFGYEVWAGDSALWKNNLSESYKYYYNIDKYYTLIGTGTSTKTFNTGKNKYFVLVARWYCCIDAIQFADNSYLTSGQGEKYGLIGGLAEHPAGEPPPATSRFYGAPDGINGNLGYKDLCNEPNSFGGFTTITQPITELGGGLTVYVADGNCN